MNFFNINNKEYQRSFQELNEKEFVTFLTLSEMIQRFNFKNNYKTIMHDELLMAMPIEISKRTLIRCLNSLREKNFIGWFRSDRTFKNVYTINTSSDHNSYARINSSIIDDFKIIGNFFSSKVYALIHSSFFHFNNNSFQFDYMKIANFMGLNKNAAFCRKMKQCLNGLVEIGVISIKEVTKGFMVAKDFIAELAKKAKGHFLTHRNMPKKTYGHDRLNTSSCQKKHTYNREGVPNREIEFNKDKSDTRQQKTPPKPLTKKIDFNFYGLDKIKNPITIKSIVRWLRVTDLKQEQIQDSVKNLAEYYFDANSGCIVKDPAKFLNYHLIKFGPYMAPMNYSENKKKKDQQAEISRLNAIGEAKSNEQHEHEDEKMNLGLGNILKNIDELREDKPKPSKLKNGIANLFTFRKESKKVEDIKTEDLPQEFIDKAIEEFKTIHKGVDLKMNIINSRAKTLYNNYIASKN